MTGLVGDPFLVDGVVIARQNPHDFAPARVDANGRADRVHHVDRFRLGELPRPDLARPGPVIERANRAQINHVGTHLGEHALLEVGRDLHVFAATDGAKFLDAGDLGHEADAAGALDAARHRGLDQRPEVLVLDRALVLGEPRPADAECHCLILQIALAALIADRAIKRMIEEQELHHPFARLFHHRRQRADDLGAAIFVRHQIVDAHGTGRDRLWHALHFDQAHPTVARNRQALMIAEAGHVDAGLLARLDQRQSVFDLDRYSVDDQLLRHVRPPADFVSGVSVSTIPFRIIRFFKHQCRSCVSPRRETPGVALRHVLSRPTHNGLRRSCQGQLEWRGQVPI